MQSSCRAQNIHTHSHSIYAFRELLFVFYFLLLLVSFSVCGMDDSTANISTTFPKHHLQWLAILIPVVGVLWVYLCLRVRDARRESVKDYDVERRYVTPYYYQEQQQQRLSPTQPLMGFTEPLPGGPHVHSWNNSSVALQKFYQQQLRREVRRARRARKKKQQRKVRAPPPAYLGATAASPPPPPYEDVVRETRSP